MKTNDAIKTLAALAQDTRLAIYRLLVERGPEGLPASAIAEKLDLPNATLSFHVKELNQAGLVSARQDGRFIYYSANYPAMNASGRVPDRELLRRAEDCGVVCEPLKTSKRKSA